MTTGTLPRGIFFRDKMFWIRYADAEGRLRREPGGTTIKQAVTKLKERRAEKRHGVSPVLRGDKLREQEERRKQTFGEWISAAVEYQDKNNSKMHAYDFGRRCVYIRAQFGSTPISAVTRQAILEWMNDAAEGGITGEQEWGAAQWNRYHSCFSSIFDQAIQRALADKLDPLPVNPMQYIPRRPEKWKERYWSDDEEEAILAATRKRHPGYEDIFTMAVEVGYRKSEQLRAVVGDYNPTTHKIAVHQRKNKRAAAFRYVPLSDRGLAAYERLAKGKEPGEMLIQKRPNFKRNRKAVAEPMTDTRFWFVDALEAAGITDDDATWHVCRHTFCSRLCAKGVPVTDVKEYAGHTDIRTTMRYTHAVEGHSDVRNRELMNRHHAPKAEMQEGDSKLQQQIATLTRLVEQLTQQRQEDDGCAQIVPVRSGDKELSLQ